MDNVLFVFNMQEMYAGKSRNEDKYSYNADALVDRINQRILEYRPEEVFYIMSIGRGLLKGGMPKADTHEADLVRTLKVKSKNIYEKNKPDCFTNDALVDFIRARNVKEIEFVGIDTGTEVGMSALTATEHLDMKVVYNEICLVMMSPEKASKYRDKIKKTRVTFKHDW